MCKKIIFQHTCCVQNIKDQEFLESLGVKLKTLRLKKSLTQLDLATIFENHEEQISRIERGKQNVTICTIKKIADAYKISLADLFKILEL